MSNFTANFRRFMEGRRPRLPIGKSTFSREQLAIVERLERQRHTIGKVRAVIDDPNKKFEKVLQAYIAYIQHLDNRDCALVSGVSRSVEGEANQIRALTVTPRSYLRLYSAVRRPIGQLLLLNAHAYCPSLPLCRSRLDAILQIAIPYIQGVNSVIIIHGNSHTVRNTRFRHWLALSQAPASIYHMDGRLPVSAMNGRRPASVVVPPFTVLAPQGASSEAKPRLHFILNPLNLIFRIPA